MIRDLTSIWSDKEKMRVLEMPLGKFCDLVEKYFADRGHFLGVQWQAKIEIREKEFLVFKRGKVEVIKE